MRKFITRLFPEKNRGELIMKIAVIVMMLLFVILTVLLIIISKL